MAATTITTTLFQHFRTHRLDCSATLTLETAAQALSGRPLTYNVGSVSDPASSVSSSNPASRFCTTIWQRNAIRLGGRDLTLAGNVVITLDAAALNCSGSAGSGFVFGWLYHAIADASNHYLFTIQTPANDSHGRSAFPSSPPPLSVPEPASLTLVGLGLLDSGWPPASAVPRASRGSLRRKLAVRNSAALPISIFW